MFYSDAIEDLYPTVLNFAVKENEIDVVAYPKWEVTEVGRDGVTFKLELTERPTGLVKDYKGIAAEKPEVSVADEEIEGEMNNYIKQATRVVTAERPAQTGDVAVIDYDGFLDGEPFSGGKAEGCELILGSGSFIPGFEEQVVGMSAGDERDINVTFPEDYHGKDVAGKAVVFKVKLHEVKESIAPTVDDEFAKDVSEFETLAELKEDIIKKLTEKAEAAANQKFESNLLAKLVEKMEVEIPEAMVDYEADRVVDDFANRVQQQGIPFEKYLEMTGSSRAQLRGQFKDNAKRQVQTRLALDAVVAADAITVSDEEIENEIAKIAEQYKMKPEEIKDIIPEKEIRGDLSRMKAMDILRASAVALKPEEKKPEEANPEVNA
ncbi:Trigger factor [bioreactor metagenome]|uniref:peptidylprolyl isomerase n=1 Tax=bioreactor metagenome TaxID=1076179 RepID=A0A645A5H0_9ZZZZ